MRYFFHVRGNSAVVTDLEGIELESIDIVRREAIQGAREMIAERVRTGMPLHIDTMFEVQDENREVVLMLSFASVFLATLKAPTLDVLEGAMGATHDAPSLSQ